MPTAMLNVIISAALSVMLSAAKHLAATFKACPSW